MPEKILPFAVRFIMRKVVSDTLADIDRLTHVDHLPLHHGNNRYPALRADDLCLIDRVAAEASVQPNAFQHLVDMSDGSVLQEFIK